MRMNGWVRLWVLLTGVLLGGVGIASGYYVWGADACYTFVSVSVEEDLKEEDRQLAEHIKSEATTKTFCGKHHFSVLLTLEALAARSVVTQIGLQWLEPSGWSFNDYDMLDVLDADQIKATEIISRVSNHVHRARFFRIAWLIVAALSISVIALALGLGTTWVRRGFAKQ